MRSVSMRNDGGFTLAEVMAALAVFAIAALALVHLSAENARAAGIAREHAFASLVAENLMVESMLLPEAAAGGAGRAHMDGRDWDWTRSVTPSGEPGMSRIAIGVIASGQTRAAASLTGFRYDGAHNEPEAAP